MKKITLTFVVALLTISPIVKADLSVSVFKTLSIGTKTEKAILENYIGGVGKGYLWANASGQAPLFCYKGDYTTDQIRDIAANAVKEHLKNTPNDTEAPVELLLLGRLKQLHPCGQ